MINISPGAIVSTFADIEPSTKGTRIVIEDGAMIDSFVKIKSVGGLGDVIIGEGTMINSGCVIYSGNGVTIGKDVLIAANCTLAPVNHEYRSRDKKVKEQRFKPSKGGIIIEDDVWVGANTVILDGSILRKGCVVGAHSLVIGELESFSINTGSPAKKVGERE
ncbi:acyltransferase [Mesobacillus subterraneus]|uniref:acyltransferase n=1 Tax=Mesobacillus subterraneus TaxID=285983 RepID=UPI001CFC8AB3|nr:acyltransferase [Mesobacillus subterraneus]